MDYKKVLMTSAIVCSLYAGSLQCLASDPVEIHPARTDVFASATSGGSSATAAGKTSNASKSKSKKVLRASRRSSKKRTVRTKIVRRDVIVKVVQVQPKPKLVPINFDSISKMIENDEFKTADNLLDTAILQKNKNILQISTLQIISKARQGNTDYAQEKLTPLLKAYPNNSDLHYAQGVICYKKAFDVNYKAQSADLRSQAEDEFRNATVLDRKNYKAFNALGVALLKDGKPQDAEVMFNTALAINPNFSIALDNLGTVDYINGKVEDATKKFQDAISMNSNNAPAFYHLAKISYDDENYVDAIANLKKAIAINPNFSPYTNLLGQIYKKQGYDTAALDMFKKAIMQDNQMILPYYNLASLYEKRGDTEFAMQELKNAISLNPNYKDLKLKLADLSNMTGKYDQAIQNYNEIVNDKTLKVKALKGLANSYSGKAQTATAKGMFASNNDLYTALDYVNEAIKNSPNDLELHLAQLKLIQLTNQPALADEVLKKIITSPADDIGSRVVKGEAYLTLGDYRNAQNVFADAIISASTQDDKLKLAEILTYQRQFKLAKEVLNDVLKTDDKNQEAINDLDYIVKTERTARMDYETGNYYLKKKKVIPAAMEYYSRSIALNPNNAVVRLTLAKYYEKKKDYFDALQNYKAYVGLYDGTKSLRRINKKIIKLKKKVNKKIKNL